MTVENSKFSNFQAGGTLSSGNIVVGLDGGINTQFTYSGTIDPGQVIPVDQGGTGATTAEDARQNLGLTIGLDVQAWSAVLDGLSDLASTGIVVQTDADSFINRTITGTALQVTVTNGSGVSGAPVISLPAAITLPGTLTLGGILNTASNAITNSVTNGNVPINTNGSGLLILNSTQGVTGISNDGTLSANSSTLLPTQAAVKAYADTIAAGFDLISPPALVATTATLNATYSNGAAGVGATLAMNVNGAAIIDSIALSTNDIVLVKDQSSTFENGLYFLLTNGDGSNPSIYKRSTNYDTAAEILPGTAIPVQSGTVNGGSIWLQTQTVTTVGTDPILFIIFAQPSNNFVTISTNQAISGLKTFGPTSLIIAGSTSGTTTLKSAAIAGSSVMSFPAGVDTVLTLASTGTVTNKTMTGVANTFSDIPYTALADGTAGELITWDAAGVIDVIDVGTSGQILTSNGFGMAPTFQDSSFLGIAPTVQVFTTGSGTYTTPTSPAPIYIRVTMVGGGAGGGASGSTGWGTATPGGNTTFGSSLLTANGGAIPNSTQGGLGGAYTINTPAYGIGIVGNSGGSAGSVSSGSQLAGGNGGASFLGGAPAGGSVTQPAAAHAPANSGSGGGGAATSSANSSAGAGGGPGAYIDAIIPSPSSTYAYTVGAGGVLASAGTGGSAGGNGGSGLIMVYEYYS